MKTIQCDHPSHRHNGFEVNKKQLRKQQSNNKNFAKGL